MKLTRALFLAAALMSIAPAAQGRPASSADDWWPHFGQHGVVLGEYIVVSSHIDNVRNQHSIFDVSRHCIDNTKCKLLLQAGSAYFGIPLDRIVATAALLSTTQQGEGTYMTIRLPSGYVYCRAAMRMTSIVPHDGPRGSLFMAMTRNDGMYAETWTPVLPWGEGRSWVEADISVVGVRTDVAGQAYASGRCLRPGNRALFYCRGGGCVNTEDRGQSVNTSSPPGANSHN